MTIEKSTDRNDAVRKLGRNITFLHEEIHKAANTLKLHFKELTHVDENREPEGPSHLDATRSSKAETVERFTRTTPGRPSPPAQHNSMGERPQKRKPDESPQQDSNTQELTKKSRQTLKTSLKEKIETLTS